MKEDHIIWSNGHVQIKDVKDKIKINEDPNFGLMVVNKRKNK